jgi:hypothetical protein
MDLPENKIWSRPYVTPMVECVFGWAAEVIESGHTGGVVYAPTRTGKTRTILLLVDELRSFEGRRGPVESSTLSVGAPNRRVLSEGSFWDWLLQEVTHIQAGKGTVIDKRHAVYEFMKGIARKSATGRLVLLIDEAQVLDLAELGWFADLFNGLERDGFEMILFLVGSYHLSSWKEELAGTKNEHIRARFFAKEHRLKGLTTNSDFRRCLRRFDVDKVHPGAESTITQYFQPKWFESGGRLEERADIFYTAFRDVTDKKSFEVPMANFTRSVIRVLNYGDQECDLDTMKAIAVSAGY